MPWLLSEFLREVVEYLVVVDNKNSRIKENYIQILAHAIF